MILKSKEWVWIEKKGGLRIQSADVSMAKKKVRDMGVGKVSRWGMALYREENLGECDVIEAKRTKFHRELMSDLLCAML